MLNSVESFHIFVVHVLYHFKYFNVELCAAVVEVIHKDFLSSISNRRIKFAENVCF